MRPSCHHEIWRESGGHGCEYGQEARDRTGQGIYSNGARNTLRNSRSSSRTGIQNARMNRVATQARNFDALSSYLPLPLSLSFHNDRNELASPSVIVRFSELSVPRFVSAAITPVTVPEVSVSVSISVIPAGASIPISVPVVVSTVLSIPPSPSTSAAYGSVSTIKEKIKYTLCAFKNGLFKLFRESVFGCE